MDLIGLKAELVAGHPTTGAYSATDSVALGEIRALNRPVTNTSMQTILSFLILENTYQTDGADTQDRSLWQRLKEVVAMTDTPTAGTANPWGSTAIGTITEIQQAKCHTLYDLFTLSAQGNLPINLTDTNFQVYLGGAQAAGVMSTTQETAFLALALAKQGRDEELGFGIVKEGDITAARAL